MSENLSNIAPDILREVMTEEPSVMYYGEGELSNRDHRYLRRKYVEVAEFPNTGHHLHRQEFMDYLATFDEENSPYRAVVMEHRDMKGAHLRRLLVLKVKREDWPR